MDLTRLLFTIGLIGKGIDSVLEVAGGVLLLTPVTVSKTIQFLLEHELLNQGRHPTLARLQHAAAIGLLNATTLAAIYLIIHGVFKVVLIGGIFLGKRWAYIGLIWILSFFAATELIRGGTGHSWAMFLFGVFDAILVFLIWKEYAQLPNRA